MNWLTPSSAFIAAAAIMMAIKISKLDARSPLNRRLAMACLLAGVYEFSLAILTAAPDEHWFWPSLTVAATTYLVIAPLSLAALLEFAAFPKGLRGFLFLPVALFCVVQLIQVWTGSWVITSFTSTLRGNVYHATTDRVPILINQIGSIVNVCAGFGALLFAWFHSQSKRYRLITLAIAAISALLNLWGLFATSYLWLTLGVPDSTGLGAGIVLLGYSILMERYAHLSEGKPDMTEPLLATLSGTALFVDAKGRIAKVPEGARRLLKEVGEGDPLLAALPGWPQLANAWSDLVATQQPHTDLGGTIGAARYRMHLLPHRNPFDAFDGALVRIIPEGQLEENGASYGLSARELDVARLVCKGFETKEIADSLFISPSTVKNHLHNLYTKTETSGRADLVLALLSNEAGLG